MAGFIGGLTLSIQGVAQDRRKWPGIVGIVLSGAIGALFLLSLVSGLMYAFC